MTSSIGLVAATTALAIATSTVDVEAIRNQFWWVIILGVVLAFLLGFGMGANDVANAYGTSVGSGVLTLIQAYILATIFEFLGAILVGYNVIDTMRKGVVDIKVFNGSESELLLGQVAILGGSSLWLLLATLANLPISTTHSIVGATLGFTLVCKQTHGVQWWTVFNVVLSWFSSPFVSGLVSLVIYLIVDHVVLRRPDPIKWGLRSLPFFYSICLTLSCFVIFYDGSRFLHIPDLPIWADILISAAVGVITFLVIKFWLVKRLERKLWSMSDKETASISDSSGSPATSSSSSLDTAKEIDMAQPGPCKVGVKGFFRWLLPSKMRKDGVKILELFSMLQIFTACFAGFSHGANDVANSIAPLSALVAIVTNYDIYQEGDTPPYVLIFGVVSICVGLWALGHRVIETVGTEMAEINSASGFAIELGAAITGLVASKIGMPISTTHCLVGSIVAVGKIKPGRGISKKILINVLLSWVVTVPAAGLFSAFFMYLLKLAI